MKATNEKTLKTMFNLCINDRA